MSLLPHPRTWTAYTKLCVAGGILIAVASLVHWLYAYPSWASYTGDTTSELLFAWDALRERTLPLLGPGSSGAVTWNLPYIVWFDMAMLWLSRMQPLAALGLYYAIMAGVPVILYVWGTLEFGMLTGTAAAVLYLVNPNVVGDARLSVVLVTGGMAMAAVGTKRRVAWVRYGGYALMAMAAAVHSSIIAGCAVMVATSLILNRRLPSRIRETAVAVNVYGLLAIPYLVIMLRGATAYQVVNGKHDACLACVARLPSYAAHIGSWVASAGLAHIGWLDPVWAVLLAVVVVSGAVARSRAVLRAGIYTGLYVLVLYLTVDRLEDRYLLPVVPVIYIGLGHAVSLMLAKGRPWLKPVGGIVLMAAIIIQCVQLKNGLADSLPLYDAMMGSAAAVRTEAGRMGLTDDEYVSVGRFPWEQTLDASSALWLSEAYLFGKVTSRSIPYPANVPVARNRSPRWYFLVCVGTKPAEQQQCREKMTDTYPGYSYRYTLSSAVPATVIYAYTAN